jgi:dihydrofolate reductase
LARKLVYVSSISLDGFIEGSDGRIDWVIVDEDFHRFINDRERDVGEWLYGRRMYELMSAYWPTADQDPANPEYVADFSRIWRSAPKVVFSSTLREVSHNSRLVRGDPVQEVRRLKAEPGPSLEVGGTILAKTLIENHLVDEYELYIQPVILGGGARLFPELDAREQLELVQHHTFRSGVLFTHYKVK